jgi:TonB-dependent SusC/RagA subfamily outer membrane receptor
MQPSIAYLLKMGLCSAILLGYYWFALRNERFHHWNRFYLLCALLLSVAVPFLHVPLMAQEQPTAVVNMVSVLPWNNVPAAAVFQWSWSYVTNVIFLLICTAMLLQLIASVIKVIRLYTKNTAKQLNGVSLVFTEEKSAPFSFFKWLFWRKDIDPDTENGQRMLQHELTHIRQQHSADKLFTELLLIVFWMNPFFWIIRRELYAIHEFLADQKAIARHDGAAFAAMILQAAHSTAAPTLSNPFFTSQLKRRLIMITTSKAPRYSYLRRISGLILMLVTTALLMLSIQQAQAQKKEIPPPPPPAPAQPAPANLPDSIKSIQVSEQNGVSRVTYHMKDGRKLAYSVKEAQRKGYYLPPPPPPPPPPANIAPVAPAAPAAPVAPANSNIAPLPPVPPVPPAPADSQKTVFAATGSKPLYIYAGLRISESQMNEIDKNNIASIDVLKGETATKLYGEQGKNGVIIITPKNVTLNSKSLQQTKNAWRSLSTNSSGGLQATNAPMYIINNEKATPGQLKAIPPENIAAINVLKGENATRVYGDEGKNGVVEITVNQANANPDANTGKVFTKAETMPSFIGGAEAWNNFLRQNLNYPLEARKAKAAAKVAVQFIVKSDGTITRVKALNNPGFGLAQEAEAIIKKSPLWNAAEQNGQKVAATVTQVITFQPG